MSNSTLKTSDAMNVKTSAFRQGLAYALGLVLTKGVSLVMIPVITHYLSLAEYGALEIIVTVAIVGGIVVSFGLVDALYRFAGPLEDWPARREMVARIFGLALLLGGIFAVALQLAAPIVSMLLPAGLTELQFRLVCVSVGLSACAYVPYAWFRMTDRAGTFLLVSVAKVVIQATMVWLALRHGHGVTGMLWANAATDLVFSMILVGYQVRSTGIRLELGGAGRFLLYGGPLVIGGLALFVLGTFDYWVLVRFVGSAALAEYALAAKFALVAGLLMQPFEMWWFPRRIRELQRADGAARSARIVGHGVTCAVFAAVTVALIGPPAIRYMTPEAYHGAIAYLPGLIAIAAVQSIGNLVNVGCYNRRTGSQPMLINMAAAATAFAGYFILIPLLGVAGAIIATMAAHLVRVGLFHVASQRTVRLPYPALPLALVTVAGAVALLLVHAADGATEQAIAGASGLVLVAVLAYRQGTIPTIRPWAWPVPRLRREA